MSDVTLKEIAGVEAVFLQIHEYNQSSLEFFYLFNSVIVDKFHLRFFYFTFVIWRTTLVGKKQFLRLFLGYPRENCSKVLELNSQGSSLTKSKFLRVAL